MAVAIVVIAEIISVHTYNHNKNLIHNISWNGITQSYIPSWRYELTHDDSQKVYASARAESVPVLVYHGLISKTDTHNTLTKDFREHLIELKQAGWQTISMDDYVRFVQGKKTLPSKSFLLTFDDGRKDSFYNADPILKALNYRATMFVIAHHSLYEGEKSNYYLNKTELLTMVDSGRWDIEAHSFDGHDLVQISKNGQKGNFYSNYLWLSAKNRNENQAEYEARVRQDLMMAKSSLQKELHVNVSAFAYPFGDYGQQSINNPAATSFMRNEVMKIYSVTFSQESSKIRSTQNYGGMDIYASTRIEPEYDWSGDYLLKKMDIGSSKKIPFTDDFRVDRGWTDLQGSHELKRSSILVTATPRNTSAGIVLEGSQLWSDTTYNAEVDWLVGTQISLISRYKDENNYVACSYSDRYVSIRRVQNGITSVESEAEYSLVKGVQRLGITVKGNYVGCKVADSELISAQVTNLPSHGMIGLTIWDPVVGTAKTNILHVGVQ